ncbi:MAG: TniB family NTP-binding protein [Cellvibrio sp.]|uniref:TniB family NTP-binding protein n=1 Tax=Cellvibrio sp. TaxID=1965322 RepID=UPI0031A7706C
MLNKTLLESLRKFDACIVPYSAFSKAMKSIEECMELTEFSRESANCALLGPSGTGKSTICSILQKNNPATIRIEGDFEIIEKPVIWAEVPPNATPKKLASALLHAMGDPNPEAGTEFGITERLIISLAEARTALVLLDEFHNLLNNSKTKKAKQATCQWLKSLINRTKTTICLVGTEEFAASLDSEIGRRFTRRYHLHALSAGTSTEPGEFVSFTLPILKRAKEIFGFDAVPNLLNHHFAKQFWIATGGMPFYIVTLIKDAIIRAVKSGKSKLEADDLAESWESGITREVSLIKVNPFSLDPKGLAVRWGNDR